MHLRRSKAQQVLVEPDLDAVLISHLHFDHLHLPSLKQLGRQTRLFVPRGAGRLLKRAGFSRVEEISIGETVQIKSVRIKATYALHNKRRHPLGPTAECIGYLIEGSHSVYFAGDTDLFPEMAAMVDRLDVALLPVWGWGPTLGRGHMDPLRAAEALQLLTPRLAIPIHWGTLHPVGFNWFKPRFLTHPPHEFAHHAARLAPAVNTRILQPGTSIRLVEHLTPGDSGESWT